MREPTELPESGEYTLVIDPGGTLTGTVAARLYVVTDQTGSIATTGDPAAANITTPGQNASFTFTGTQNQRVSLRGTDSTIHFQETGCDVWVVIRKPDDTDLSGTSTCMESDAFMAPVALPASGQYKVVVDPNRTAVGELTLRLYDVVDQTGTTLTIGAAAVPVTLMVPGQQAVLTFSGTPGQQATVRITSNGIGTTTVTLRKPDQTIATTKTSSATSFNLTTQTLVSGSYTVTVDPSSALTGTLYIAVTSP